MPKALDDPEEIVSEYLNMKHGGERQEFWKRRIGRYHASDFGKCLRSVYYEHTVGKKADPSSYPNFHLGHKIEDFAENALSSHYGWDYIKNSYRIKLDYDDFVIVGQTDPILVGNNGDIKKLFEIKSTSWIRDDLRKMPKKPHIMQTHPYMAALPPESVTIIYLQKTDLETVWHKIDYSLDTFSAGLNRINELHRCLKEGKPPEAEPLVDWQCKVCDYQKECPRVSVEKKVEDFEGEPKSISEKLEEFRKQEVAG